MDTKRSSSPPGQLKNMLKHNRCKSSDKEKNMQISIVLPDAIAHYLTEKWGDLDTRIMEMIAVEAYRDGLISVGKLSELLGKRPFKLKQGVIDFWVPTFLFLKRDDFAIFN